MRMYFSVVENPPLEMLDIGILSSDCGLKDNNTMGRRRLISFPFCIFSQFAR
jgi:hypothetical protein